MSNCIIVDVQDNIATLTINRPEALNALNSEVLDTIYTEVRRIHEQGEARAIILTGAGKAFVAGADISEMKDYGPEQAEEFSMRGQNAFHTLRDFPGPVIAAINGFALGGGLELALACDVLIAADSAKLGLPETTLAVIPGFGGTQTLPRRVGPGHAKRLLFTGDMIGTDEALAIGLVDAVVPEADLIEVATKMAAKALRNGPIAIRKAKRLVDRGEHMDLQEAVKLEAIAFGEVFGTADQKEGMAAFLGKRKAEFKGK
jgi:enoyl-CoA hydratase